MILVEKLDLLKKSLLFDLFVDICIKYTISDFIMQVIFLNQIGIKLSLFVEFSGYTHIYMNNMSSSLQYASILKIMNNKLLLIMINSRLEEINIVGIYVIWILPISTMIMAKMC